MAMAGLDWARRRASELILAALAAMMFLGCLGSPDLWGKREQRSAAETLDTVENGNWLVARIQGRKRLEKPPLPRWTIASLILVTGRSDEWILRLPGALSALGMVGLTYALGRRIGGRSVGLAAGLALTSIGFFISETRQAGNDAPLAFFTTLAIYAAYRRLHGDADEAGTEPETSAPEPNRTFWSPTPGARVWSLLMYLAMGLGFLTKGPIILILVGLTVLPYLATIGRFRSGTRRLWDPLGLALLLVLALSWPVPVLLRDPGAVRVWSLEMAQKTTSAGIKHMQDRDYLILNWPGMTSPWLYLGALGTILPFVPRGRVYRRTIWLPWWWAIGNLVMFCFWKVAKPNYYLPCIPGVALLVGLEWVRLTQLARRPSCLWSRLTLQSHWVVALLVGLAGPVVMSQLKPEWTIPFLALGVLLVAAVVGSILAWRRGADALALAPIVAAIVVGGVLGYGSIAPTQNSVRSHKALAATLGRLLPDDVHTVHFFGDLDEGLWFYLRDRRLVPVPKSQSEYNRALELNDKLRRGEFKWSEAERLKDETAVLLSWLRSPDRTDRYLMIRAKIYDRIAHDLEGIATPMYREQGLERNELVLLQVAPPEVVASIAPTPAIR
jgi:4-amino-4-deoxy-L-arabinose transferase-like glycosyltransferase